MIGRIFQIESELGLRLVTGEFEIIACLYRNGPTRSKDLSHVTKVSIANFQGILRRLKGDGIILSVCDPDDRRARLFDLVESVRQACDRWFANDELTIGRQVDGSWLGRRAESNGAGHLIHGVRR